MVTVNHRHRILDYFLSETPGVDSAIKEIENQDIDLGRQTHHLTNVVDDHERSQYSN